MKKNRIFYWIVPFLLIALLGNAVYAAEHHPKEKQSSALKGQYYLEDVVKIYIPSTYNVDQPIDNTPYVNKTLEKFSKMFGGATSIEGTGAWLSDDDQLIN